MEEASKERESVDGTVLPRVGVSPSVPVTLWMPSQWQLWTLGENHAVVEVPRKHAENTAAAKILQN